MRRKYLNLNLGTLCTITITAGYKNVPVGMCEYVCVHIWVNSPKCV